MIILIWFNGRIFCLSYIIMFTKLKADLDESVQGSEGHVEGFGQQKKNDLPSNESSAYDDHCVITSAELLGTSY